MKIFLWLKQKAELITAVTVICSAIVWGFKFLETKTTKLIQGATVSQTEEIVSKQTTELLTKLTPRLDQLDQNMQVVSAKQEDLQKLVKNHKHSVQKVEVVIPQPAPAPVVLPSDFLMKSAPPIAITPQPQ